MVIEAVSNPLPLEIEQLAVLVVLNVFQKGTFHADGF